MRQSNTRERSAASLGASVGASLGGKSGPFGAGIGAGFGGAIGYVAGALTPRCGGERLLPDGGRSPVGRSRRVGEGGGDDEAVEIPVDEA